MNIKEAKRFVRDHISDQIRPDYYPESEVVLYGYVTEKEICFYLNCLVRRWWVVIIILPCLKLLQK